MATVEGGGSEGEIGHEDLSGDGGHMARGRGRGRGRAGGMRGRGRAGGEGGNPKMVYVGNLSYNSSWQDLKDHMRKAGEVVFADIFRTEAGHSKGCGVVEYATESEAQAAISTLNETTLEGTDRAIFVREDRFDISEPFSRGRGRGRGFMPPRGRGGYMMGPGMFMSPLPPRGRGFPIHGHGRGAPPPHLMMRGGGPPMMMRGGGMVVRGGYVVPPGSVVFPPHAGAVILPPHMHPYPNVSRGRGRGAGPVVEGPRAGRQLFIGNLPYHTSWQDLKDLFAEFGTILRADVLLGPDGRSKGMGTICFETEESAQKAIEKMNEYEMEGRTIYVTKDKFAK